MLKRVVSFVLSIAMMASMVPVQTFAAEAAETEHAYAEKAVVAEELTEAAPTELTAEETIPEVAQEAADAYSGTCGSNLTWTLSDEGVLTISGTGDMYDYSYYDAPWYDYERPITALSLDVRLTSIGDCAFVSCTELTSVTIPDSVTSIESDAFNFCDALRAGYIPSSVTTISAYEDSPFRGCSSSLVLYCGAESKPSGWDSEWNNYSNYYDDCYLQVYWNCTREVYDFWTGSTMSGASVTIPGYVNLIPDYAFADRTDLTSVTIPASVMYVGTNAFSGCSESLSIRYGGTKEQWIQA